MLGSRVFLFGLLLSPLVWAKPPISPVASAQSPLNSAQQAELAKRDAEMIQAALRAAQMVDANQLGVLWDGASAVAKKAITRDAFLEQVSAKRARFGALITRGQGVVTQVRYGQGAQVPEGVYVNVIFPTRFAKTRQPVHELVSFRLDEDKVWRLSGYSLPVSN